MQGFEVLWLPGTDHAGVGTQTAVEKHLRKTENKTRHDLGREEFLRRVLDWQDKHGGIIIQQLKRLGCSCDWSRQRYTFDDDYVRAVESVFVDLYGKGLIYRGRRMINWDPSAQTALVGRRSHPDAAEGHSLLRSLRDRRRAGPISGGRHHPAGNDHGGYRVAVHPDDPRYRDLIGKHVWRPLAREKLPIVGDEAIDPKFGTGVLKVTPAHDKVDFEIGQRHSLPVIDVLHPDGRINCPAVPELDGLDRFAARKKAAELLQEQGCSRKRSRTRTALGSVERSEVPIEPRLSEQWFLRYPKTKEALDVVRDHLIRFFPQHWEKVYAQWLENIQDWCISRQIWWGHRIPAWYRGDETRVQLESPGSRLAAGSGYARYLVFVLALGLRNDGRGDAAEILSDVCSRHRGRHHLLLGRAHDHRRARVQAGKNRAPRRQHSVPRCLFDRAHSRQTRGQDVEIKGQFARSSRFDREVWRGRIALWFDADRAQRTGLRFRREADRGGP